MAIHIWYIVPAVLGVLIVRDLRVQSQTFVAIPYSRFERYLEDGLVRKAVAMPEASPDG